MVDSPWDTKKVFTDATCDRCDEPLLKIPWAKNREGKITSYIIACDNPDCLKYRNPVKYETKNSDF